jgi:CRP-like cAMP-binding protein
VNADDLKRFRLLSELEEHERLAVADEIETLELDAGTCLFDEGQEGDALLLIAQGGVSIASTRFDGATELGEGEALGALALVQPGPHPVRAETTSRSRILVLSRSAYQRIAAAEPRIACRLLEAILRETARLGREAVEQSLLAPVDPTGARD